MSIDKTYVRGRKSESASCPRRPWLAAAICLSLYFSLYACTTPNYGTLQPSSEITNIFENNRILSDHLYYFSGLQGVPDAIIAVQPNYSLRSGRWRQIDFTALTLKTWVFRMTTVPLNKPQGAWILDPDGNRIGIWFASQRQTVVRLEPNNRVVVVPPDPPDLQRVR
ncbi:MAG: hypothetical protein V3V39_01810 [Desulfobacterales bacterium]|jgi:hypothetical protein